MFKFYVSQQKEKYSELFKKYFLKSFSSRLAEYTNPKIEVQSQEKLSDKYTIVSSILIATKDRPEVKIQWRVYTKNPEKPLIRDLIIEGLSLARTQKEEFGSIIKSNSYLEEVTIDENSQIGPSARLRPKTKIGKKSNIGNFVEIKNSKIGNNVSIAHLSYVGDSEIGNNVNIGAGTITCNYDGKKKHKTIIKDNVFIGSNTSLIAPVVIESKSRIGAGSVITKNIPKNSLAIERSALKILRNKRSK